MEIGDPVRVIEVIPLEDPMREPEPREVEVSEPVPDEVPA